MLSQPLPERKLYLFSAEYQEFLCSESTLSWLKAGGMTKVDGRPVRVVQKAPMDGGNVVGGYYFAD